MDEQNNFPTRRPMFSIASVVITTIPLIIMIVGSIKILCAGGDETMDFGAKLLLHLMFCTLGAPFASMISILASYIGRERGESKSFCKSARVYAKIVLFASLAFLAGVVVYSLIK